jgi:membrane AbrB-like protein
MAGASPPQWLFAIVQIVIGASIGTRFAGMRLIEVHRPLLHAMAWAAVMLGMAALMARLGSTFFDRTFPVLLLGTSPGVLAEMVIVTYALGIDVAFVITCHVCRVLLLLLITPIVGAWLARQSG